MVPSLHVLAGGFQHPSTGSRLRDPTCIKLVSFIDADFARESEDRRSTTGAAHRLESSGAFAWHSQRQKLTSRSTTESELIALSSETDDTVVYRQLLADLGLLCKVPTPIWMAEGTEDAPATVYEDNRSAITIIRDRQYGARTKFLDVRLSTLRERERDRILELCECPTEAMLADPFTKPLSQKQHAAPPTLFL